MAKAPPRPSREIMQVRKLNLSSYLSPLAVATAIGYPELAVIKATVPYTDDKVTPPHHHDCLNFWIVLSGKMLHGITGDICPLEAGDLLLLPPMLEHSVLDVPKMRNDAYNVSFSDEYVICVAGRPVWRKLISLFYCVPAVLESCGQPLVLHAGSLPLDELRGPLLSLYEIYMQQSSVPIPPERLAVDARRMFTLLSQAAVPLSPEQSQKLTRLENVVCTALEHLYDHFHETVRLQDVASASGLSVSRFSLVFKTVTGMTLTEYLNFIRIRRARYLLLHTTRTERSILQECGFHSDVYFSRVFKAYTGCPPYIFRREYTIVDL